MAGQIISTYEAKFGFQLDNASVKKIFSQIDAIKSNIEKKFAGGLRIDKISLSPTAKTKLTADLKEVLKQASTGITIPVNKFQVNAVELRKQVQAAFDKGVTLRVNAVKQGTTKGGNPSAGTPRDNRTNKFASVNGSSLGYGLLGGMMGVVPAFAAVAGAMSLNRVSEQIQSGKVSLETITKGRGQETFDWLRKTSNEVGMDYRSQLPVFGNYMASSINKQGYENARESYKDISLFGLTHGATNLSMERAMLALGQMWSKGKVNGEELNSQLAEATGFGGAKELFAKAYQEKIGGHLTGQKAEAALIAAMKKGKVISSEVLPILIRLMREEAAKGMSAYEKTTQFQRGKMSNAWSDTVMGFGKGGFDSGMARIFKTLADTMNNSTGTVKKLGEGFDKISIGLEGIINSSTKVINFFMELSGAFGSVIPVAAALYKIIGTKGSIFAALMLAFDDLDGYLNGKDSVLGQFIGYMTELTGMDFKGIAFGFSVVGVAILAAFSPITALALSIGGLIEAYKYLEKVKAAENPQKVLDDNAIPTREEVYKRKAAALGKSDNWFTSNVVASGALYSQHLPFGDALMSTQGAYDSIPEKTRARISKLAASAGVFTGSPDWNNAMFAIQSGTYGTKQFEDYLTQRASGAPKIFPDLQGQAVFNIAELSLKDVNNPQDLVDQLTKMADHIMSNHQTGEGVKAKPSQP